MTRDARDHAKSTDPLLLNLGSMIRRMAITLTAKALWQLAGFRQADGTTETRTVETFNGIGLYARPPSSGSPEAIMVSVGDSKTLAIVAVRDEKTRAAVAGAIVPDETMLFNSQALVYVKADGTIEIRTPAGTALPLATKADVQAIATYLQKQFDSVLGHTHGAAGPPTESGGGTYTHLGSAPNPAGTSVLKGQ